MSFNSKNYLDESTGIQSIYYPYINITTIVTLTLDQVVELTYHRIFEQLRIKWPLPSRIPAVRCLGSLVGILCWPFVIIIFWMANISRSS